MVMYAREDVVRFVPPEGHGCGRPHNRPLRDPEDPDSYVATWGIDCPPCEALIQGHPQWSTRRGDIPMTPDQIADVEAASRVAAQELAREKAAADRQRLLDLRAAREGVGDPAGDDVAITVSEPGESAPVNAETVSREADYQALDKATLKDMCSSRGLAIGGTKADMVGRLVEHDRSAK